MSSGASSLYEKPLPGISSWGARDTQIEQESIDAGHLSCAQELVQVPEVSLEELVGRTRSLDVKPISRRLERHVVLVDPEQQPLGSNLRRHLHRVTGTAERAIAHNGPACELELLEHFLEHDWFMPIFRCQRTCPPFASIRPFLIEEAREDILGLSLTCRIGLAIPNHQAVVATDDRDLAIQVSLLAVMLGKADAGGGVYFECGCRAVQSLLDHAVRTVGGIEPALCLKHRVNPDLERVLSEHVQGIDFLSGAGRTRT